MKLTSKPIKDILFNSEIFGKCTSTVYEEAGHIPKNETK